MATQVLIDELKIRALMLAVDSIRATTAAGAGHPTSSLSCKELCAVLFFSEMKYDLHNPDAQTNDRFILSKGHAVPVVYAAYKQLGVISDKELLALRHVDSVLEGHPTPRFVYHEAATGSLGQGLGVGVGMALHAQRTGQSYRTYVLLGDGEMAEGSVWEALHSAAVYNLSNLVAIVDINRLGQSQETADGHDSKKYARRIASFGWHVIEINGHDIEAIKNAFVLARTVNAPVAIVATTFKGHGLKGMENKVGFHGRPLTEREAREALGYYEQEITALGVILSPAPAIQRPQKRADHATIEMQEFPMLIQALQQAPMMATRKAFGYALCDAGAASENLFVVDGDVKNSTYTEFFENQFPHRFVQAFIAEQLMIGLSTGIIQRGGIAVAATFGAFFARAYDQIRMAAIGRVPLKLVGSHCGVSIGSDGPSQMALEDIALMRALPDSIVLYPADSWATARLFSLMLGYNKGISYLRITRAETPHLYTEKESFFIGGANVMQQSEEDVACVVAAGITLHETLKAYKELKVKGIQISVIDAYSIKPLAVDVITAVAKKSRNRVVVVEDHYAQGGLYEAVAAGLCGAGITVCSLSVRELSRSGSPAELMSRAKIDASAIVAFLEGVYK